MFGDKNNKNEILINKKTEAYFGFVRASFFFFPLIFCQNNEPRNFSLALTGNLKLEPVFKELNLAMHDL